MCLILMLELNIKLPNFSKRVISIINFERLFTNFIADTMNLFLSNVGLKLFLHQYPHVSESEFYVGLLYSGKNHFPVSLEAL